MLVLAAACDSDVCDAPERTRYSCEPVPTGSMGCVGGPTWEPSRSADDELRQDDPALTFPIGCRAEIPDCSGFYPANPRPFVCSSNPLENSGASWSELL